MTTFHWRSSCNASVASHDLESPWQNSHTDLEGITDPFPGQNGARFQEQCLDLCNSAVTARWYPLGISGQFTSLQQQRASCGRATQHPLRTHFQAQFHWKGKKYFFRRVAESWVKGDWEPLSLAMPFLFTADTLLHIKCQQPLLGAVIWEEISILWLEEHCSNLSLQNCPLEHERNLKIPTWWINLEFGKIRTFSWNLFRILIYMSG